jgi:hypothetical protein
LLEFPGHDFNRGIRVDPIDFAEPIWPWRQRDRAPRHGVAGEPIGGPSFVVFVAQLEPTNVEPEAAVAKFTSEPEVAVAKFTSEPEAAVAELTSEPEAAVAKSTAVEPEDTGSGSEANAVTAKAPAKAATAKVPPTEATSAVKGRHTQRRAGCGDRRGDQTNRYLAHHDAHFFVRRAPLSLYE